jgi:hypothetical protein
LGRLHFAKPAGATVRFDIEMLGTLWQHRYSAALSEGMSDLSGNCDSSDLVVCEVSDHDLSANSAKTLFRQAPNPCEEK